MKPDFNSLKESICGDLFTDKVQRALYATDASQYRELPMAVTRPKNTDDVKKIIAFARENGLSVIPRGAGTSLAGQVVGAGIVIDVSKYMNSILEFNRDCRYVVVEPGVVLAELNMFLARHGFQFGPETSTANRCVIGGMLGNNSCGLHSLAYGSVRDHILEVDAILADGSEASFGMLGKDEFQEKLNNTSNRLEHAIYQTIHAILSDAANRREIHENFPDPRVTRRNMGYALDVLLRSEIYDGTGERFNMCKLLAGSEGTLAFFTRIKLNLVPVPPKHRGLMCAHFDTLEEALEGNLIALKFKPTAVELMDDPIMQAAKQNIEQNKNRFFIQGNPGAILMIEFAFDDESKLCDTASELEEAFRKAGLGYHYPLVTGAENIKKVWALRTAGLGLLSNIPGDRKGVPGIEDTAVLPEYLPAYIADIKKVFAKLGLDSVFYAHIATGEIHFRPLINFKEEADVKLFEVLMYEVAALVKKYRGSMSGEHGDGRVRGELIAFMLGEHNYRLLKQIKQVWDPHNVFNPGKIVDTPPLTQSMRVSPDRPATDPDTVFDFSNNRGFLRSIEKCNGSGDCRKSRDIGGTMCPTFMVTGDEDKSTRGRANLLREFLSQGGQPDSLTRDEIYEILDLCLSCKACKAECPSNVDMTKLKAEFLQNYYDTRGIPLRSRMVAYLPVLNRLAVIVRPLANYVMNTSWFKKTVGFTSQQNLPELSKITLARWVKKGIPEPKTMSKGRVYLFNDEFTNYNESDIGIQAILLLTRLGYEVKVPLHNSSSGRTFLSKGLVRKAKKIATQNVMFFSDIISDETPLIGLEPSAVLTFRDEYPELVDPTLQPAARKLAKNTMLLEEFISLEIDRGNITPAHFTKEQKQILLHGHCQQKAIASTAPTIKMLSLPDNYSVSEIPSGCCGMAGSFGYEKEHYELSQKIGEMTLFPAVCKADRGTVISAPGTSCRHHIQNNTGRAVKHPVEIMYDALRDSI